MIRGEENRYIPVKELLKVLGLPLFFILKNYTFFWGCLQPYRINKNSTIQQHIKYKMKRIFILTTLFAAICFTLPAQTKPEATEFYSPVPPVVTPGSVFSDAPSDAIVLFDGRNLDQWVNTNDSAAAKWVLADGVMTVNKSTGDIQTRAKFHRFSIAY